MKNPASTSPPQAIFKEWEFRKFLCLLVCGVCFCAVQSLYSSEHMAVWGEKGEKAGELNTPWNVATDKEGNLYVADKFNHRVQKFDPDGEFLSEFGFPGEGPGSLNEPSGVAVAPDGSVYVTNSRSHNVQKFHSSGAPGISWGRRSWGTPDDGEFNFPTSVAVDRNGDVYVICLSNNRFQKFDSDGNFLFVVGGQRNNLPGLFNHPQGIALDDDGNIYIADAENHRIQKLDAKGEFLLEWGNGPGTNPGEFHFPYSMAVSPDGKVFVSDTWNGRVQVFTSEGVFLDQFGDSEIEGQKLIRPLGIALGKDGDLFVSDCAANRIHKYKIAQHSKIGRTAESRQRKEGPPKNTPPNEIADNIPNPEAGSGSPEQPSQSSGEIGSDNRSGFASLFLKKERGTDQKKTVKKEEDTAAESKPYVSGANPSGTVWKVGDNVFVDWSNDEFWYPAKIVEIESDRYFVHFADGDMEWTQREKIALDDLKKGDPVQGNWKMLGAFFSGKVVDRTGDSIQILYDDGDEEFTTMSAIRITR